MAENNKIYLIVLIIGNLITFELRYDLPYLMKGTIMMHSDLVNLGLKHQK